MIRAILFDFNGVIIDDEPIHMRLFQTLLAKEGISMSDRDYYDRYLGYDDRGCFREALKDFGRTPSDSLVNELIRRKARSYEEIIGTQMNLFPGASETVLSLSKQYRLGVVSGALRHEIELVLKRAGLRTAFHTIISAEDVIEGKPSPESYEKALASLRAAPQTADLRPDQCLVVEDSVAGIESAHGASMRCVAVAHSYPESTLGSADWVIRSLRNGELQTVIASMKD